MPVSRPLAQILGRLRDFREAAGITTRELETELILGPGWVESFETGRAIPSVDALLAILHAVGRTPGELFGDVESGAVPGAVERSLFAEEEDDDLLLRFRYADFDASYVLPGASLAEFEAVLRVLRDGLAGNGQKSDAIVAAFRTAMAHWPHANPSDIWWFLVQRAYLDPFNHPASEARRDLAQSWKRAAGWALERILVAHYGPFLQRHGVSMALLVGAEKERLLGQVQISSRLEIAKVDVVLSGRTGNGSEPRCFGVVHVKASFAERRTDDVELSRALIEAGYCSPFWTMDCKSAPGVAPVNKGELGELLDEVDDFRSAKRKDFEVDGFFSGCFSYNARTKPTPPDQERVAARVYVCDLSDPDDDFSRFVLKAWDDFRTRSPVARTRRT